MSVIDDYFKGINTAQRNEFERIRKIVKKVAPEAEEVISYGMPAFKYKDKYLIGFAVFKNHSSLFPTSEPIRVLKDELGDSATSKGAIQFTLDKPLPESIITKLVEVRLKQILDH